MHTIGILLDHDVYRGVARRRTGQERIDLYRKAAAKYDASVLFMSLSTIHYKRHKAKGYEWKNGKYRLVYKAIPKVIHNRAMPFKRKLKRKLNRLAKTSYVFNARTRYSKYRIHRLLHAHTDMRTQLPLTRNFTKKSLAGMMRDCEVIFVKPQSGSVGKGIYRLAKTGSGKWHLRGKRLKKLLPATRVYQRLRRLANGKAYLLQKGITLATYRNRPYDVRVSVQRNESGYWQITGMVGKLAAKGSHVTNIARGGKAKRVEQLFTGSGLATPYTKQRVQRLSLKVVEILSTRFRRLADVGLDIGVERTGKPYFIEVNGRDQRYSFAKAGLHDAFRRTYENPVRYALHIIKQGRAPVR